MADGRTMFPRSGRQVLLATEQETVEIRGPDGRVELELRLTPDGVVLVANGPVRVASSAELTVHAREVAVHSAGDLRLEADGEVFVRGARVHLN